MSLKVALLACLLPLSLLAAEPEEKKAPPEKKEKVDLQVDWSKVSPEKILSLIKQFEDDPLKAKTDGIAGLLLDFGEKSEDVLVEVNLSLHPYRPHRRVRRLGQTGRQGAGRSDRQAHEGGKEGRAEVTAGARADLHRDLATSRP